MLFGGNIIGDRRAVRRLIPNSVANTLPLTGRRWRCKTRGRAIRRSDRDTGGASNEAGIVSELAVAGLTGNPRGRIYPTGYLTTQFDMPPDRLDSTFAALADPTRRAILARLAGGEASVTALAAPFAISLPAISKHLKVLERAGLIGRSRDAQWRRCRLDPAPLKEAALWLEQYRRFWEESFDRLANYLGELQRKGAGRDDND
jgi:DNA-binding transcriptional ArsR family regulator